MQVEFQAQLQAQQEEQETKWQAEREMMQREFQQAQEADRAGSGSSVHADYGLDDGSFAASIHSISSSLSWSYSYSCEWLHILLVSFIIVI